MKTKTILQLATACITMLVSALHLGAETTSYTAQVRSKPVFLDPLEWVGQEPVEADSAALLGAIGVLETNGVKAGFGALETFLKEHPQSAWAPSLRINLADYYRSHGRYSLALAHWEAA